MVALSLALLLYNVAKSKPHWSLYLSPIALLLISFYAPGVGQGLVVVLLGFAMGHRLVMGAWGIVAADGHWQLLLLAGRDAVNQGSNPTVYRWRAAYAAFGATQVVEYRG